MHYTRLNRRAKKVEVSFKPKTRKAIQHLAINHWPLMRLANG
uniref:Uncharacterized protein n=2 Tax=Vibrio TaxID=662 RepID=A0A0H4A032_9VIBR|nr:hypothetical protein [Vibrio splendidus]AKN40262.1 hypothetical protein [Vibrio tasmaniensis]